MKYDQYSIILFRQVHFSKHYTLGVWPFNQNSVLNHFENVKNLENLYRMATHSTTKETIDSEHLDHVIDLLIGFLKVHRPNAAVCENVIDLVKIFQRSIQIKVNIFQELKRLLLIVRMWKVVPKYTVDRIYNRFVCMQRCTSCMNLEMVAKRLTSPKVCTHFFIYWSRKWNEISWNSVQIVNSFYEVKCESPILTSLKSEKKISSAILKEISFSFKTGERQDISYKIF